MAYEMVTRTGRSFWEVTSVMQNSIRKGDFDIAGHCLWEMFPQYMPYLRKRLLVISAEDCFGIVTKEILNLCTIGDEEAITKAVAMLCQAKKSRDADYFVCNLMYYDSPTGMEKTQLAQAITKMILKMDVVETGHLTAELFKKSRKELWNALHTLAQVYHPELVSEFEALNESNERVTKPAQETIFVAKAIVLLWTKDVPKGRILAYPGMEYDGVLNPDNIEIPKDPSRCDSWEGRNFPDWAYNWHTTRGKYYLRRDAVHAIENDQRLLTPLEENLFDDCTWNRDLAYCLQKHNPRNRPIPYDDGKLDPGVKYGKKE